MLSDDNGVDLSTVVGDIVSTDINAQKSRFHGIQLWMMCIEIMQQDSFYDSIIFIKY